MIKVGDQVVAKHDQSVEGKVTRIKGEKAYILLDKEKETTRIALIDLVKVTIARPAKASGKAKEPEPKITTKKIQIVIQGTIRGPTWKTVKRNFDVVSEAKDYLQTHRLIDVSGKHATLDKPAEAEVRTNYEIDLILKGVTPKHALPVLFSEEDRPTVLKIPAREPEPQQAVTRGVMKNPDKPKSSERGSRKPAKEGHVPLKAICRDIGVDPREARVLLRSLARSGKLVHEPQGRWEWPPNEVLDVKKQIQKNIKGSIKTPEEDDDEKVVTPIKKPEKKTKLTKKPEKKIIKGKKNVKQDLIRKRK